MNDQELQIKNFSQTWPKPSKNNPIIIIGTGGIVKDAHLPAYKKAGFIVHGLYDVDKQKAEELAQEYKIENVYDSLEAAFENKDCIFDLALPPAILLEVVDKLPENIRREKGELIRDKKLNQYEAFADIDFSLVIEEKVWSMSKKSKRVNFAHDTLIEWLKRRKEERILLVTHYKVIKDLFPTGFEEVENCKVFETNLFEGDYYLVKSGLI